MVSDFFVKFVVQGDEVQVIWMNLDYGCLWVEVSWVLIEVEVLVIDFNCSEGWFYVDFCIDDECEFGWFSWFSDVEEFWYIYIVVLVEWFDVIVIMVERLLSYEGECVVFDLLIELFDYLY